MEDKKHAVHERLAEFDKHYEKQRQLLESSLVTGGDNQNWIIELGITAGMSGNKANVSNAKSYLEKFVSTSLAEQQENEQWATTCGYASFARAKMGIGARGNRNDVLASQVPVVFQTLPPTALVNKTHSELGRMQRFLPAVHKQIVEGYAAWEDADLDVDLEMEAMTEAWLGINNYEELMEFHSDLIRAIYNIEDPAEETERDLAVLVAEHAPNDEYFGRFYKEELEDALGANPVIIPVEDWHFLSGHKPTAILVAASHRVVAPEMPKVVFENLFAAFCQELVETKQATVEEVDEGVATTYLHYHWNKSVDLEQLQNFVAKETLAAV